MKHPDLQGALNPYITGRHEMSPFINTLMRIQPKNAIFGQFDLEHSLYKLLTPEGVCLRRSRYEEKRS